MASSLNPKRVGDVVVPVMCARPLLVCLQQLDSLCIEGLVGKEYKER
jgi:hypothetical protein